MPDPDPFEWPQVPGTINRPGMPPRYSYPVRPQQPGKDFGDNTEFPVPTYAQFPMRVSDFLQQQKAVTMFAPPQTFGDPFGNDPPTEWPAPGTPIKVPKCVYLSSVPPCHLWGDNFTLMTRWTFPGYFPHYDDPEPHLPSEPPAPSLPYGALTFPGFIGTYEFYWTIDPQIEATKLIPRWWTKYNKVHNPIVDEHNRLIAEFQAAKEYLEATYPNDVFVHISNFFPDPPDTAIAPNDEKKPKVLDVYTEAQVSPDDKINGPLWMLGPNAYHYKEQDNQGNDVFKTDFFGTDFLHIYAGYPTYRGNFNSSGWVDNFFSLNSANERQKQMIQEGIWATTIGYPLDKTFGFAFDQWKFFHDIGYGYEGTGYQQLIDVYDRLLNKTQSVGDHDLPQGKLAVLKTGIANFSGHTVLLHEYDLSFDVGTKPDFRKDSRATKFPRHDIIYTDQDWIEQNIVLSYQQRQDEDPNPDGDHYYPGLHYNGGPDEQAVVGSLFNYFERFPSTGQYRTVYTPELQFQWSTFNTVMNGLGPGAIKVWNQLIEDHELGPLGYQYQDHSSVIDVNYIVQAVINHYGLEHKPGEPGGSG